jgi:hypothetical protein
MTSCTLSWEEAKRSVTGSFKLVGLGSEPTFMIRLPKDISNEPYGDLKNEFIR